jgi:hypothetical protein
MGDTPTGGVRDIKCMHRVALVLLAFVALAVAPGRAAAAGGNYVFNGGTTAEQTTVKRALDVSSFNWSVVPATIKITIARGLDSEAVPGEIRLDSDLLDSGRFSWGVVQHEYAHQVDFLVLSDAGRSLMLAKLGTASWWGTAGTTTAHGDLGGERFASTLAWAYWTSADNSMRPASARDEAGAIAPAAFRALLQQALGSTVQTTQAAPTQVVAHAPAAAAKPAKPVKR